MQSYRSQLVVIFAICATAFIAFLYYLDMQEHGYKVPVKLPMQTNSQKREVSGDDRN